MQFGIRFLRHLNALFQYKRQKGWYSIMSKNISIARKITTLPFEDFKLNSLDILEVIDKYPEKALEVKNENGKSALVLDNMRIKYQKK